MKKNVLTSLLLMILCVMGGLTAQPGRPGGYGGFRGNGPQSMRPNMTPPNGKWDQTGAANNGVNASSIQKKKRIKEGTTFKVVGSLRDSVSGELLPFVNVSIIDSADNNFIKGGSTNLDGYFEITGIPQGGMILRISAIGYQNKMIPFHVSNNTALGTIRMKPGATTLQEVVITDQKPLYAMDGEKMIYNVADDPTIQTGTTSDALQNAPGVEVDVEGNVTLNEQELLDEWGREFLEEGRRRMDLIRFDRFTEAWWDKPADADHHCEIYPLSQEALSQNIFLVQNPGYPGVN